MPFIHQIVEAINTAFDTGRLKDKIFKAKYYGIAQTAYMNDDSEEVPVLYDSSGNGTFTGFDDAFNLVIYHRCTDLTYQDEDDTNQFGDYVENKIETADMRLIAFADRSKINMTQESLAHLIASGIKDALKTLPAITGLSIANILLTSVTTDQLSVYNGEYKTKLPFPVKPSQLYFAINYQIITHYNDACTAACDVC